ncbi:MAG: hypothetical protein KC731_04180 [Myxococcales bacterium]|nr:hypothetical protein [Myxococcales bacterium]
MARRAIEHALFGIRDISQDFDREAVGERLAQAICCTYAVIDSEITARVHYDGLQQAASLTGDARTRLQRLPKTEPGVGAVTDDLTLALSALQLAMDDVAQEQLERRLELHGEDGIAPVPPARPFRASQGLPQLHALERRPLAPTIDLSARIPEAPPPAPPVAVAIPKTEEELRAFADKVREGRFEVEVEEQLADEPLGEEEAAAPIVAEVLYAYLPAEDEAAVIARLARNYLENVAIGRDLRRPNAIETWTDQEPFEQTLLESLDAFAALGEPALEAVSLYHAEDEGLDPGRGFAVAFVLGCIEGRDTVDAAVALLKQSAPESYPGFIDGFVLAPDPHIDRALRDLLQGPQEALVPVALEALWRRGGLRAPELRRLLDSDDPEVQRLVATALRDLLADDEATMWLEDVLDRGPDEDLFWVASESLLARSPQRARARFRTLLDGGLMGTRRDALAWLLGLGGDASDAERLVALQRRSPSVAGIRGLGRLGHVAAIDVLYELLAQEDEHLVLAAAEALERIVGSGLRERVDEPWELDMPPEAEELSGMPWPTRAVERVPTDREVWHHWLGAHRHRFARDKRLRGGEPFVPVAIVDELIDPSTPPARRADAALELRVRLGVQLPLFTDDWVAKQRQQLSQIRGVVARLGAVPGAFSLSLIGEVAEVKPEAAEPPPEEDRLDGTMGLSQFFLSPDGRVLPFSAKATASPDTPSQRKKDTSKGDTVPTLDDVAAAILGGTADGEVMIPDEVRKAALPFAKPVPSMAPSTAPLPPVVPSVAPAPAPPSPAASSVVPAAPAEPRVEERPFDP